ncbi:MAG TPA: TraB/GumN family protein [Flavobacteriales bacterium]|nr:TraB/GumN family protein [Flavobacteriales bacterium]
MKHLKKIFPLFFILACGASTDSEKPFNEELGYKFREDDKSLLWEISGKGLKQPSFLYGTIHLQDKRVFSFDKTVTKIFDTCKAYAMEVNMDEVDKMEMAKSLMLDKPLNEIIGEKKFGLLDSLFKVRTGSGLGMMYSRMKPFFMAAELIKAYEHQDMTFPLDIELFNKAKKEKMKVIGIEKMEEQLSAVNKMTIDEQTDMVIEGLKDWDKSKELYNKMIGVYLKQDIEQMALLMKDTTMPASFETALLTDRNKVMAKRIDKIVQEQPTFNAVGAGHLYGKDGVIELLRKEGYTMKPVKYKFTKK